MARICKSINAGSRLEVASNWEEREWGVTANAHWGFFWGGGKNVLELGSSDGYTIQWIYFLKKIHWIIHFKWMNFMACEFIAQLEIIS